MDMPEKTDTFRANIREQCRLQGMTQDQLATKARLSPEWLSKMLCGKSNPTLPVCERIAQALKVPLGSLLKKLSESAEIPIDAP